MSRSFRSLSTLADLDHALQVSHAQTILLFKHSATCGTSAMAQEELVDLLDDGRVTAPIYMVHVHSARAVSNAVADRFGVRHESPQVFLIANGAVVWHGSHYNVTAAAVRSRLGVAATAV